MALLGLDDADATAAAKFCTKYYTLVPLALVLLAPLSPVKGRGPRSVGFLDWFRFFFCLAGAAMELARLFVGGADLLDVVPGALTLKIAAALILMEARKGGRERSVLRAVLLLTAAGAVYEATRKPKIILLIARAAVLTVAGLSYGLFNAGARQQAAKPDGDYALLEEEETPEDLAGPLSSLTFSWLSPMLATGYRRALQADDLFPLIKQDEPGLIGSAAKGGWTAREKKSDRWRLIGSLAEAFGPHYAVGVLFKLMYDSTQLVVPLLLSWLLKALGKQKTTQAYMVSGLMVGNAVVATALLHQYFQRTYRTGMRLKSAAISLVYEKALFVAPRVAQDKRVQAPPEGQQKNTTSVTNLMSVDAQRLQDNMTYFATVVSGVYQIVVCLYLLYSQLGPSAGAGFAVMLAFLPVTQKIVLLSRDAQKVVLRHKDARIKLQSEALQGIKIVKLYGWEQALAAELKRLRRLELTALWQYKMVAVLSRVVFSVAPTCVSLVTFALFVLLGGELTVPVIYTSIALFNVLRFPLMMVPNAVGSAVEAVLSVDRIATFLKEPDVTKREQSPMGNPLLRDEGVCWARDVRLMWNASEPGSCFARGLEFSAGKGELLGVVGETGSGKSGLFAALLGEVDVTGGSLGSRGSIAYAAQSAWIQNATLKANVLFGSAYDERKYADTLFRCALLADVEQLADGDSTLIGEKGLNLSGGQKQRVALARALYADADLYLLDDPLSAVDAHVAKHLFEHLICAGLIGRGKTVLLATHNTSTLAACHKVLCLYRSRQDQPTVKFYGPASDYLVQHLGLKASDKLPSWKNNLTEIIDLEEKKPAPSTKVVAGPPAELVQEAGSVSHEAKVAYISATGGVTMAVLVVVARIIYQAASIIANWWLGYWAGHPSMGKAEGLEVYAALSVLAIVLSVWAFYIMAKGGQRGAEVLHDSMLDALLVAPMAFFDKTPVGRLLNLFSKDVYTIDEELPQTLSMWLMVATTCVATLVTIGVATPLFIVVALPLGGVYAATSAYFIPSVRQLKRLDAVSRTPVFSSFEETADGATTIRAFGAEERFMTEMTRRLRRNLEAYFLGTACNRWLAVRLEFIGTATTGAAAFLAVFTDTDPVFAGLSLTYALNVTQALNWFVRMNADLENNSVAVERVVQCSQVQAEREPENPLRLPLDWPQKGSITLTDVQLRYRPELPLVLKSLTFDIAAGSKVGLVGRTGSGKSSFLLALLRIVPPEPGSRILLDDVDLSQVSLCTLRTRLSMIPQDPVLFTGTLRYNLDPFGAYDDETLLTAISDARIDASRFQQMSEEGFKEEEDDPMLISGPEFGVLLNALVEEGGKNFSVGERQLLCLARAVVRNSRLVLLDEATSAVDYDLDKLVQETIRDTFRASTVIAIAHRLNTVLDYDRVIVMDRGEVVEDGSPKILLENPSSKFAKMAAAYADGAAS